MKHLTVALFALLAGLLWSSSAAPPSEIRNVLVVMGDDHAAYVLGAYGNEIVRTPNLDRLAAEGVRFRRAYANSPVCTPSRQSLITGRLPHATGVTLLRTPLSSDQVTIADHLKQLGFETGAIGKMHFNSGSSGDDHHGFDYRTDRADYRRRLQERPPRKSSQGIRVKPPWKPFRDPARIWLNADSLPVGVYDRDSEGTYYASRAIEFLKENRDRRFCLWLSFYEPHSPFDFPIEYAGRYRPEEMPLPRAGEEDERWIPAVFRDLTDEDKRGIIASYYSSVEYLDKNVGLVLEELDRLGLADSTLVVYAGDHGYLLGHHGRFEKHMMWEEAVRAPLILRNKPRLGPAKSTEAMVEFIDLVPTVLELLGTPPLASAQGRSLVPLLDGQTTRHREFVFSEFLPDNKAMVRGEEWKYIFSSGKHDLEMGYATGKGAPGLTHRLYNVRRDTGETCNLADEPAYQDVLRELQQAMLRRFHETHPAAVRLPKGLSIDEQLSWFCEPPEQISVHP
ncbi:MAG: sulfatase family protein [Acidobacteriota bacterium]